MLSKPQTWIAVIVVVAAAATWYMTPKEQKKKAEVAKPAEKKETVEKKEAATPKVAATLNTQTVLEQQFKDFVNRNNGGAYISRVQALREIENANDNKNFFLETVAGHAETPVYDASVKGVSCGVDESEFKKVPKNYIPSLKL
ncbi:MAG: hypothetical protein CMD33_03930 [Flavobacteriales bacterium]|nr:hypothetical protein [Flavobacteriales bacterium]